MNMRVYFLLAIAIFFSLSAAMEENNKAIACFASSQDTNPFNLYPITQRHVDESEVLTGMFECTKAEKNYAALELIPMRCTSEQLKDRFQVLDPDKRQRPTSIAHTYALLTAASFLGTQSFDDYAACFAKKLSSTLFLKNVLRGDTQLIQRCPAELGFHTYKALIKNGALSHPYTETIISTSKRPLFASFTQNDTQLCICLPKDRPMHFIHPSLMSPSRIIFNIPSHKILDHTYTPQYQQQEQSINRKRYILNLAATHGEYRLMENQKTIRTFYNVLRLKTFNNSLSSHCTWLAVPYTNNCIEIVHGESGKKHLHIPINSGQLQTMRFSPDERYLATVEQHTILGQDIQKNNYTSPLPETINATQKYPSFSIQLYATRDGSCIRTMRGIGNLREMYFTENGIIIAFLFARIAHVYTPDGAYKHTISHITKDDKLNPFCAENTRILTQPNAKTLTIVDTETNEPVFTKHVTLCTVKSLSPDGTTFLTVDKMKTTDENEETFKYHNIIEITDIPTGELLFKKETTEKDELYLPDHGAISTNSEHAFLVTQKHVLLISAIHNFRKNYFTVSEIILMLLLKTYPIETTQKITNPHSYLGSVWNRLRPEERDYLHTQYIDPLNISHSTIS